MTVQPTLTLTTHTITKTEYRNTYVNKEITHNHRQQDEVIKKQQIKIQPTNNRKQLESTSKLHSNCCHVYSDNRDHKRQNERCKT